MVVLCEKMSLVSAIMQSADDDDNIFVLQKEEINPHAKRRPEERAFFLPLRARDTIFLEPVDTLHKSERREASASTLYIHISNAHIQYNIQSKNPVIIKFSFM